MQISFGLVCVPVKLYKATDEGSSVSLCNVHNGLVPYHKEGHHRIQVISEYSENTGAPVTHLFCPVCQRDIDAGEVIYDICNTAVKEPKYCPACEKMLESGDLQKAYPEDRKKEHCIPISEEEMAALPLASTGTLQIDGFIQAVPDIRYYNDIYVLEPDEKGMRAFALFERAMKETGLIGVSKMALGSKEHLCAIRPTGDGLLYVQTLHYTSDIRDTKELKRSTTVVSDKELAMAKMLMDMLPKDVDLASYKNEYGTALKELVDLKKQGITITAPVAPVRKEVDLIDQLMASLKQAEAAKVG